MPARCHPCPPAGKPLLRAYLRIPALVAAAALCLTPVPASASSATVTLVALRLVDGVASEIERSTAPATRDKVIRELRSLPGVIAVDIDRGLRLDAGENAPSDPEAARQWGLLRLDRAELGRRQWEGTGVTVAVVDTGVDATHPDLAGAVLPGFDAFDASGDGRRDPNGHGTHVAGIIAAARNGSGVEGLAPGVRILPVRVLDASGYGEESDVARGVLWAVENGAQVINMSLGGDEPNALLAAAVLQARRAGVAVIVSAGNDGATGSPASYPAADPGTYAVAATDAADRAAYFSTRGSYVDIAAPGVLVLSTWTGSSTRYESGTSMSAPYMSASVAVVMQARGITPIAAADLLISTATDIGPAGTDIDTGAGLVDPYAASTQNTPRTLAERTSVTAPPAATLPPFDLTFPSLPAQPVPALKPFPLPTLRPLPVTPFEPPTVIVPPIRPPASTKPSPSAPGSVSDRRDAVQMTIHHSRSGSVITLHVRLRSPLGPLTGRTVSVTAPGFRRSVVTDSLGRIQLRVPAGKVTARFAGDRTYRPVSRSAKS